MAARAWGFAVLILSLYLAGCSTESASQQQRADAIDIPHAAAYGDSTTQGDGVAPADRWTTLLAAQTGWNIENFGANGALSEEIAARWGSVVPVGTIEGDSIPAKGASKLALNINPIRSGLDTPTLQVDLRADDGSLVRGTLSRSGRELVFTRDVEGSPTATRHVEVHAVVPDERRRGLLIVGMGINNEDALDSGAQTIAQVEGWYRGMTSLHRGRLIVWGMIDRGLAEAPGTARGDYIAQLESWLSQAYGTDFVPVRQYLSSQRALDDAATIVPEFTPTSDDLAAVAAGCVPPSFRIGPGSAHLNKLGHQLQTRLFYRHMTSPQENWVH